MSQAQGIPFTKAGSSSRYRLIELPLGLDTLLTSPGAPRLTLESTDDAAVLKTPDRTYSLRQKNTSNTLMVVRPDSNGGEGIEEVGTVHETIELDPVQDKPSAGVSGAARHTGSKGKWHERFGTGR